MSVRETEQAAGANKDERTRQATQTGAQLYLSLYLSLYLWVYPANAGYACVPRKACFPFDTDQVV